MDPSTDGLHLDRYIRVSCVKGLGGTAELVRRWSASVSNDGLICVWTHDWVDHWETVETATGLGFLKVYLVFRQPARCVLAPVN